MAQDRDHDKKREEREEREKREHEHRERDDAKHGGRERVVAEDPETQRRDQQRQQTQSDPQSEVAEDFQPGPHIEGTVVREGPEGPRPGTPRQAPAAGDILMGSPGVDEFEMTRIQMEPHPEASPEMIAAPFAQPLPQPDHGIGTEGRRIAEERMGLGHLPNPPPPLPRIKVDESPKYSEDLSARDAREAEKVSTGGATQQQNQAYAGQVRPEEGRANLNFNTPKGEHLLGKQDIKSRLPRPPLNAGGKVQERRDDTRPGRNAVSDHPGRDQRSREPDTRSGPRDRDEERSRNQRQGGPESGRGARSGDQSRGDRR
jgi:hypothetical protein